MGELRFVLGRAVELVETKRDRADLPLAGVRHQSEKRTGIDTRGEKNPNFDIRQQVGADTVAHRRAQTLAQFGGGGRVRGACCENCGQVGERQRLARTSSIDPLRVPSRQRANVAIERERFGDAAI